MARKRVGHLRESRIKQDGAGNSSEAVKSAAFPIVGVGASAGGLEAFTELLKYLPPDTGLAFVLVQHLDPQHESLLTQLLARGTSMPVQVVTNNLRVEINQVYVIPPNRNLGITRGVLTLHPRQETRGARSIDFFLEALAEDQEERAIGVILSGTASDGTLGLEAIKAAGGITFAQDDSARYDSMPRSAVAAGCVDFVLSPMNVAKELARVAKHPYVAGRLDMLVPAPQDDGVPAKPRADGKTPKPALSRRGTIGAESGYTNILALLRSHSGVDFTLYKSSTIQRRTARRLVLNKLDTLDHYADFLRGNVKELDALYSDLLISVTSFFRNPEAFDALQRRVFRKELHTISESPFRVWVLGCSTGQEAYSIAMAYVESADKAPRMRRLQIFATDLNETLLAKARYGLYASSLVQDITPERLRRFFVEEEGGYRVVKSMRDMVVFARQNLINDPPFSRMDLISCRNVLIYLDPDLQKQVMPSFHYALRRGGFLFLGASESIGTFSNLFESPDKKHKIFARKDVSAPAFHVPVTPARGEAHSPSRLRDLPAHVATDRNRGLWEDARGDLNAQREADRVTVNKFAPPGVLINAELQVIQFRGATGAYLEPPSGKASFDVLKMAREGLMLPLRATINKAKKEKQTARRDNVRIMHNGNAHTINVEVIPLKSPNGRCFLVLFEDAGRAGRTGAVAAQASTRNDVMGAARKTASGEKSRHASELEAELSETREYLQSMQEQHEASNEELQASNEEVQSANEELQSINEELETSKEELESTNEELTTVNEEMANRNVELNRLNSDLINFQTSTKLAIIILGRDLTIRHFSAQAEREFRLVAGDVGRPIGRIRHDLVLDDRADSRLDLETIVSDVIDTMHESELEVRDAEGRWFSLRAGPYVTVDKKVDGAVLVLMDISQRKRTEQEVEAARDYAEAIVRTSPDPLVILSADLRVHTANEAFYRTFAVASSDSEGRRIYDLGNGQWNIPQLKRLLEEILPHNSFFRNYEVTHDFEGLGRRTMLLNASRLNIDSEQRPQILLGIQDVTDVLQFQIEARESAEKFKTLFERSPLPKWTFDLETLRFIDVNAAAVEHYGYTREEFLKMRIADVRTGGMGAAVPDALDRASYVPSEHEICQHRTKRGEIIDVEVRGSEVTLAGRQVWLANVNDITERKRVEEGLKHAARQKDEFLAMLAHELRNPLAPIRNAAEVIRLADGKPDVVRWATAMIERQMGHLSRLVDDLLDASRINQGKIELRKERLELGPVVNHAAEAARQSVAAKSQTLTVTLPPEPIYLDADQTRLTQVMGNLLNNASKFTKEGGSIWITVEREVDHAVVRVQDTGIGIASDQLQRIFDMFVQGERSLERSEGGLGIGLMLVKRLAELHAGTVEARSDGIDLGSEFVVRLPVSSNGLVPPTQVS